VCVCVAAWLYFLTRFYATCDKPNPAAFCVSYEDWLEGPGEERGECEDTCV
jgi:hypothetical protein